MITGYNTVHSWFVAMHSFIRNGYSLQDYCMMVPWEREVAAMLIIREIQELQEKAGQNG